MSHSTRKSARVDSRTDAQRKADRDSALAVFGIRIVEPAPAKPFVDKPYYEDVRMDFLFAPNVGASSFASAPR